MDCILLIFFILRNFSEEMDKNENNLNNGNIKQLDQHN